MDINKLLEYARIDAEKSKLSAVYAEEAAVKEYATQNKRLGDAYALIEKLNQDADGIIKQIGALTERYQEAQAQLNEYQAHAGEIEDENEADFYSKNVEKLLSVLTALASDISALGKTIADVRQKTDQAKSDASNAQTRVAKVKPLYAEVNARYAPQVNDINLRLKKAAEGLGDELRVYQNLKKSHVKRPMVTFNGTNCGGCSMDIDANTMNRIETTGYALCPNCGRIVYKPQS